MSSITMNQFYENSPSLSSSVSDDNMLLSVKNLKPSKPSEINGTSSIINSSLKDEIDKMKDEIKKFKETSITISREIGNNKEIIMSIFSDCRGLTEEEAILYEESMEDLFQPTGKKLYEV